MALIGFWGFDDAVAESGSFYNVGLVTGRNGGRAVQAAGLGGSGGWQINLPGTTVLTSFVWGAAITTTANSGGQPLVTFRDPNGNSHITLNRNSTNGAVYLTFGSGAPQVNSAVNVMQTGVWTYLEVKGTIADAGGTVEVRVNGTVVLNATCDTNNAGTGVFAMVHGGGTGWIQSTDDMYILDTTGGAPYNNYLGDIAVQTLLPNGNGDLSEWTNSAGNSTNNSTYVDETDSSATDYVGASAANKTDLYQMADVVTANATTVLAVQELVYSAKVAGGTSPTILPVAKGTLGTVRTDTALTAQSTTYQGLTGDIRTTDPDGNPLTVATVNAMQVGVKTT